MTGTDHLVICPNCKKKYKYPTDVEVQGTQFTGYKCKNCGHNFDNRTHN